MKKWAVAVGMVLVLGVVPMVAQETYPLHPDQLDGLWQGYDGEWRMYRTQLVALAEATPAESSRDGRRLGCG